MDYLEGGSLLPFGGHKGYALMLAVEFFGRVLSGADAFSNEEKRGGVIFRHSGVTMMVMKADLFQSLADYSTRMVDLGNQIRSVPSAPGFEEVLLPGDLEARAEADPRTRRHPHRRSTLGKVRGTGRIAGCRYRLTQLHHAYPLGLI